MGLFDKVEKVLSEQVADLQAKLAASEKAREQQRARHEAREEKFFATEQDLIHTICLLKGIPVMETDEHGNSVEVKPTPSVQRRTWSQVITGKELEARERATERARQVAEANKRRTGRVQ
jgi:hypothetical protein